MTGLPALGIAAKLSGVGGLLKKIPWQVWAVIALLILAKVGSCVHEKKVEAFGTERYTAGKVDGRKERDAEIIKLQQDKAKSDRRLAAILRSNADAENKRIDRTAVDVLMRGPGKSACPNPSTSRSGAGGHEPTTSETDASRPGVPTADRAAVPWNWLVKRATEHDKCLVEADSWRKQQEAEEKAYKESLANAP